MEQESPAVVLEVLRDEVTGGLQVSIGTSTVGYRLLGPKFVGHSTLLAKRTLTERDAKAIRRYLDGLGTTEAQT